MCGHGLSDEGESACEEEGAREESGIDLVRNDDSNS
jgi:hypothetical protein